MRLEEVQLKEIRREGHWRCFARADSALAMSRHLELTGGLNALLQKITELPTSFKDNHRSRVLGSACESNGENTKQPVNSSLFSDEVFARHIVAKQPKNKNQSRWSRALSLVRSGEARQTFLALQMFNELGIKAGAPILVLEKRRLGMIVDSWVIYEYLAGDTCVAEDVPQIIEILTLIHDAGFQHKDPTFGNFYRDAHQKMFVIDCVLRPGLGNFSRCRDLMMLVDNNDAVSYAQVAPSLKAYQSTPGFFLYSLYRRYRGARDAVKYRLRGRKPKNR